jgi:hypothetical protein
LPSRIFSSTSHLELAIAPDVKFSDLAIDAEHLSKAIWIAV